MKLRIKIALLGMSAALLAFPFAFGSEACAKMWGDFLGDALILSIVDQFTTARLAEWFRAETPDSSTTSEQRRHP